MEKQQHIKEIGEEIWKDILNYIGYYQCSNFGRIKSLERYVKNHYGNGFCLLKEKILKQDKNKNGYFFVVLYKNGKNKRYAVSRLVCTTFHGPCPEGMECLHGPDFDKSNNHESNLHWGTKIENMFDKIANNTTNKGEQNGRAKLTWKKVEEIREKYISRKYTLQTLANEFKISSQYINLIVNNKIWVI